MASSSNRKSDSSGSSAKRKRVHVGTGTVSRKASAQPETHLKGEVKSRGVRPAQKGREPRPIAPVHPKSGGRPPRAVSAKQAERIRRQRDQRRLLLLRGGMVAIAVALLWGTWSGVSRSQLFEITSVEVQGTSRLLESEVTSIAAIPDGATLLRVDSAGITDRLMQDPWIADADVSRRIPSTLRIEVVERVPVALVDTGVSFWYVDGDARVLSESGPTTASVLPTIRDLADFTAEPGKRSDSRALRNALAVLRGVDSDLAGTVKVVTAPSVDETALLTAGNVEIMIGEATQLREKSLLIANILAERGGDVVFIDVRSVERPISRGLNP